jgi:hypothetical protein
MPMANGIAHAQLALHQSHILRMAQLGRRSIGNKDATCRNEV